MSWFLIPALLILFSFAYAALSGAPWVPTWKRDIERARRLLDLKPGEKFVELGCGDGRVVLSFAQEFKAPLGASGQDGPSGRAGSGSAGKRMGNENGSQSVLSPPFKGGDQRGGWFCVGVELSLIQYLIAQTRRLLARAWNTHFVLRDAFRYDLRDADAVYLFLIPETYEKIRPKLEEELKPGARVVSYVWPIPSWTPAVIDEAETHRGCFCITVRL